MSMTSQVLWKQPWDSEAEATFIKALASIHCKLKELSSQQWDSKTATIGGIRDIETSYLAPASEGWSSALLHLNSLVAEPLASELSRITAGPAIVVLEYDQDAWGYSLFGNGKPLDQFWNSPEAVGEPAEDCVGNIAVLTSTFGVASDSIVPYLRHITEADQGKKAFADDEFTLGNHWVRVDFMRRLGLKYPSPGEAISGRYVKIDEPRNQPR